MILNALEHTPTHSSSPRKRSQSPVRFQLDNQQSVRKSIILNESEIDRMMMHWEEYKFKGPKISRRSYHASVFHDNALYAYGGYEINAGILSDFQRLDLAPGSNNFLWKAVSAKGTVKPGPRYRHSAVLHQDKMYVYGGQINAVENTDKFMAFDFNTQEWSNVEPVKENPTPTLDSHCATLWNKGDGKVSMVIVGGFMGGKQGGYSNAVYEYSFDDNKWRALFSKQDVDNEGVENPVVPQGRMGLGAAIKGDTLYMFGGNEGNNKMNDLWKFDLNEKKWTMIKPEGKTIPEQRNGHSLDCYKDFLILFGGILDVTHEKNDIYIFSISKNTWYNIEKNTRWIFEEVPRELLSPNRSSNASPSFDPSRSPARKRAGSKRFGFSKQASLENIDEGSPSRSPSKLKNSLLGSYKSPSPSRGMNLMSTESLPKIGGSPGKDDSFALSPDQKMKRMKSQFQASMEEKYMKDRMVKKMALLKEFEVSDDKKEELRMSMPTMEAMQKSIQSLGLTAGGEENPDYVIQSTLAGLEALKAVVEKNVDDGNCVKAGVKPVARDGHSATRAGNKLFILAGDRHKMSFNDLFALNLEYFDAIKS